jgi:hypothetical protein
MAWVRLPVGIRIKDSPAKPKGPNSLLFNGYFTGVIRRKPEANSLPVSRIVLSISV